MEDAGGDAGDSAPAVSFEIQLRLERVVDRLDDLSERFEEALSRTGFLPLAGRTQQGDARPDELGLKLFAVVVFVGNLSLSPT